MTLTRNTVPADRSGYDALAADGRIVRIRAAVPEDVAALRALYEETSDRNLYLRFFSYGHGPIEPEVRRLTREPGPDHLALVAFEGGELLGVASYERADGAVEAEFAALVADAAHGRGIGTLLLEELLRCAHAAGIRQVRGEILVDNAMMLKVARDLAPGVREHMDAGVAEVCLSTTADEAALAAMDLRERHAERQALRPLLMPASVAIVGAGRQQGGVGHEVLTNLIEHGFTGPVYPINLHAKAVAGLPAYPRLSAAPGPVDLAVIAVPAASVEGVLADATAAGVRAAVVLTAGFGEADAAGRRAQARLVRLARAHDMRLVGPNCLGVLNTDPAVRLAATFSTGVPAPGGLAVASQSGAVGIAVLDHAARTGVGISSFVSLGNKADVSSNDLLAYWYDEPGTRAVALYLESFGNPRRFARVARALARRKPVLAVKSGRSAGGRRAGASHTAAAASPDTAVDSLFAQAGVVRTDTLGDMLDAARLLVDQPLPAGNRIGIAGNAGGLNVLAADTAEAAGLTVPEVSGAGNPVDLGAAATPGGIRAAIRAMATSGQVDAVLAIFAVTRANDVPGVLAAIAEAADAAENIPVAAVVAGLPDAPSVLGRRRIPVFGLPEQAVRALGHAARYSAWRRQPLGRRPDLTGISPDRARAVVDQALASGAGWQPADVTIALLDCYGIPTLPTVTAYDLDGAVAAATRLGYPVALKAADPAIVHKSDRGVVRLDLTDTFAVRDAYRHIAAAVSDPQPPVVVQPMCRAGAELVVGVVHDPLFGSLVMLGLGGVLTDLLGDRTFRLLPVTDVDAGRMWRSLRGAPLLTGYRGSAPVDLPALEDLLLRVGRLAEDVPEVTELDLNPVIVSASGLAAVDAKLRLSPAVAEPDPTLRALLEPAGEGA